MGAQTFATRAKGSTAKAAFRAAKEAATEYYGNAGYTGSILEKGSFNLITAPAGTDAYEFIDQLIDNGDKRIDDKWGPAGCIKVGDGEYIFFGWASC